MSAASQERARARAKEWYWANRDRSLLASKGWAARNREISRERARLWALNNPERAREAKKRTRLKKREKYLAMRRAHEHNRRQRKAGDKLSSGVALQLFSSQDGKCKACHATFRGDYEMDHILPLALGGRNLDENMQLLCRPCNRSKGARHPSEWKGRRS